LIVSIGTREEHEALVYKAFELFTAHKIVFKFSKTALFKHEIDFLGHTLTQTGVCQQLGKTSAIMNWKPITLVAELRSFLGLASYYRKFIDGFAKIISPLSDLLWDEKNFPATLPVEAEQTFTALKQAMCSSPVLKYFDASHETQLWTDARAFAIGGALLQRDENGDLRPIGYYSRRLTPAEEKYSTYARELLAIRDCLLAFRYYLMGLPFVVKTDHCSLRWIMDQKSSRACRRAGCPLSRTSRSRKSNMYPARRTCLLTPSHGILTPTANALSTLSHPSIWRCTT
jgi:hypothetical protein